jgi:hypothetical protein
VFAVIAADCRGFTPSGSSERPQTDQSNQCDPKAAAKMIGCSPLLGARSLAPKSELKPTTTKSNRNRSPYRMPTPFWWCLNGSIYQQDDLTFRGLRKGSVGPLNCSSKAW